MAAGRGRLLAVLALLFLPVTAVAQVIPPGAQPGREREQLAPPAPGPQARPVGDTISLPSTVAPAGAESIKLTIGRVVITGATVYSEADLAPLYADLVGAEVPLAAVYESAGTVVAAGGRRGRYRSGVRDLYLRIHRQTQRRHDRTHFGNQSHTMAY